MSNFKDRATTFIQSNGNQVEQARLRFILTNEPPSSELITQLFAHQRADGGWSPFWAQEYSSLDATCFRLAQAEQLGIDQAVPAVQRAIRFLRERQSQEGSWEEDLSVVEFAPPWAVPGDLNARLYLTANCGFWLALLDSDQDQASTAAVFLQSHLDKGGHIPGFTHTQWLAGGLWYRLGRHEQAEYVFGYLIQYLGGLAASELAWMLATLRAAGVMPGHHLVQEAVARLERSQKADGRFSSTDGPGNDVHTTLEALRALLFFGRTTSTASPHDAP